MNQKLTDSLVFIRPGGGKIKLPLEIVDSIQIYIQNDRHKPESGGVVLGRYIIASQDIVIDKISFPLPGDKSTRTTFFRKQKAHQAFIDREWEASNQTCTYLGEWHTHPEAYPTPSCIDKFNWKRKLKEDVFDSEYLYFLIVGTSELRVWEGHRPSRKIVKLSPA